jgi:hypothetical protein
MLILFDPFKILLGPPNFHSQLDYSREKNECQRVFSNANRDHYSADPCENENEAANFRLAV